MQRAPSILLKSALLAVGLATALAPAQGQSQQQQQQGVAIVIGGALKLDNVAVWKRVVDEAGGRGARFAVFATAAGNPERSAGQIVEALNAQGAQAEFIPVAPRLKNVDLQQNLQDPALIAKVRAAQGVYFSGGAQELIVDTLQPEGRHTEMLRAIWSVYGKGGVVAGSSAGAAIMSRLMFRDAQDPMKVLKGQMREGREIDRGLGFVGPDLLVDQHFLKRGRIGRILPLMQAKGYKLGLGIEENSAAVLRGDELEVIGGKGALLIDLGQASSDARLSAFNIRNAQLSYLDRGDRHNLRTGQSTPSAAKLKEARLDPAASDYKPYNKAEPFYLDILGDTTIVNAMAHLIDSTQSEVKGLAFSAKQQAGDPHPDLGFEFRLYKGEGSVGWFTGAFGGEDYTVLKLRLDVLPVLIKRPFYTPVQATP